MLFTAFHGGAAAQESAGDSRAEFDSLFQTMLAKPADVEITLRFAALAVRLRDYEAAIGAYERLLFFEPNLVAAKIELGFLYFRLRSYRAARAYFEAALDAPNLEPDLRSRIDSYIVEIDKRLSPNQFALYWHGGIRYQTNASAGPSRLEGVDPALNSLFAQRPDWNAFGAATATYVHDFQNQRGDTFESALTAYYSRQFDLQRFNLGALEVQAGPRFGLFPEHVDGLSIRYYGIANGVLLGDRPYYSTLGGGVSLRYVTLDDSVIEGAFEYRDRDFRNSTNYPLAAEQTGNLMLFGAAATHRVTDQFSWQLRTVHERNHADTVYNDYRRSSVDFGLPILFNVPVAGTARQWVFTPYVGYSHTEYGAPNPAIDPLVTRTDREWRAGASVDALVLPNAGFRLHVHYTDTHSTLANFTTKNLAVSFGPAGRF